MNSVISKFEIVKIFKLKKYYLVYIKDFLKKTSLY